jgi:hypothetical protein
MSEGGFTFTPPSSLVASCASAGALAKMSNPAAEAMIERRMPSSPINQRVAAAPRAVAPAARPL